MIRDDLLSHHESQVSATPLARLLSSQIIHISVMAHSTVDQRFLPDTRLQRPTLSASHASIERR